MESLKYNLLQSINNPEELRKLSKEDLPKVCSELRDFIIDSVSTNPGHFGASLGVVELTVALHYVFNTPYDQLVWDVGHQAYGHKIITGRRDRFDTNRKMGGISGFPKRSESEYDSFGVGHSSTSISAALGMAVASKLKHENRKIVAIIGDGAMTGGMAFEGLNNAGFLKSDILVILNDNNIAIDPNVGSMSQHLLNISKSQTYNRLKDEIWEGLGKLRWLGPLTRKAVQKMESALKSLLFHHSNLFEGLNFRYFGPIDGHDVIYLAQVLSALKEIKGPKLLHVITRKGKGFPEAEMNQTKFHAPGKFDKTTGKILSCDCELEKAPKFQNVFGETIVELAGMNEKIVGITPAMPSGCSLNLMMEKMPNRAFDVGIAEQHAVTFAAGLATQGMVPFCNIYSTFMQRAYDQVIHDVALQNLHVVFCIDRGGLVGEDGATHHGVFDMAYMRSLPNMVVAAPMDTPELRNMMYTAQLEGQGPFSIRYPRGCGTCVNWRTPFEKIEPGTARMLSEGTDLAILTIGKPGIFAQRAVKKLAREGISAAHYDMRFVKPLDETTLLRVFSSFDKIITVEDGVITGGFGSAVAEFMATTHCTSRLTILGIPDRFIEHGTIDQLYKICGIDTESLFRAALILAGK
ncbi:MAG TPA: 1-deoxy-D-xylulose-5-phosphate synthase [Prolixibacteraceae bacterium]|jgi:1-deoxy-D-xylulose-5-phosphate synthase|nr:1-deoxy-D-xylulose-5-phosphate synthase [Prolixibacteraceae bacterium]HOR99105.1 1-deoxy-D-xylulose-5-phosphate synthase [Prolixibacteraceae bacterium]HOS90299.1 1-deoxy-D-xylulose-5-phosphate synthase [Prolixibacteraceae bacterium]HPL44021.1 1-deoxy-D-xylulose-5-phosphate synthase [Prolixibacteraceae bacterium]HQE51659.1 1-deoxy-D-xylulose-5-phosphate synthase [Prolixibacteraceae bacterium]